MAKILIVDDRSAVLAAIEKGLTPLGHELCMVQNGRQALDRLEKDSFDLLVTDLMMPEATGFEVLEWLKEHAPRLPVVICSAYAKMDTR